MPLEPDKARSWTPLVSIVIAMVACFHLLTIRPGHDWGGDFAMYISHARNICAGCDYADTGYVYTSEAAVTGPAAYPPLFPVFLAAVMSFLGENLVAFKVAQVGLLCVTLCLNYAFAKQRLSERSSIVLVAVIGLSPVFWRLKDQVLSEHLFIPLWSASILLGSHVVQNTSGASNPRQLRNAIILGTVIYLTIATRSVGIVLLPTVLLLDVLNRRKLSLSSCTTVATCVALMLLQRWLIPGIGGGYTEQLSQISASTIATNLRDYTTAFSAPWDGSLSLIRHAMAVACTLAAIAGFYLDNRNGPSFLGTVTALYFALIVLWPAPNGTRMILPLLPAYAYYALRGCSRELLTKPAVRACVLTGMSAAVCLCFIATYAKEDYSPITEGPQNPAAVELFRWVRSNTAEDETILFFKPRVLAMYSERQSAAYPQRTAPEEWAAANNVRHAIVRRFDVEFEEPEPTVSGGLVFENDGFRVFRMPGYESP